MKLLSISIILFFDKAWSVNYYSPRCPIGWSPRSGDHWCYKFFDQMQLTWNDAKQYCESQGSELVTVHSKDEKIFLGEHQSRPDYLIGLSDPIANGKWLWVDNTTWTLTDSSVIAWNPGEPNGGASGEHCVELTVRTGGMNDISCTNLQANFICKRDINSLQYCPSRYDQVFDQCFYLYNYVISFGTAIRYAKIFGGSTVVIKSQTEAQYLMDKLTNSYRSSAWISLKKAHTSTTFQWLDMKGKNVTGIDPTPFWGTGEPNTPNSKIDYCVQLKKSDLKWHSVPCTSATGFFIVKSKLNCALGWTYLSGKCVQFNRDTASYIPWQDSHDICEKQNATMLHIKSSSENALIDRYVYSSTWIGITDVWKSDGQLHDNQFKWYDSGLDVSKGYTNWFNGKPAGVSGRKDCIYLDGLYKHKGKWSVYKCTNRRYFTCEAAVNHTVNPVGNFEDYYCDAGWTKFGSFCYWFVSDQQTWPNAVATCKVNGSSLVSVVHADEASFLDGTTSSDTYWTGLNDQKTENKYVWQDIKISAGIPLGIYKNWDAGQPDDHGAGESNCMKTKVSLDGSGIRVGKWDDEHCNKEYQFVCKKKAYNSKIHPTPPPHTTPWPKQCGPYWKYESLSGYCYRASENLNSWEDAETVCQAYGGHLASIHTVAEATAVAAYTREFYKGSSIMIWIGANDRDTEGGWQWTDGSAMSYLNWKSGQPDNAGGWFSSGEDCVEAASGTVKWNDNDCGMRRNYLCKKWGGGDTTPAPAMTTPRPPGPGYHWDCPNGWSPFGDYCYKLMSTAKKQSDAMKDCRMQGADLVSIHSNDENDFVLSINKNTEPLIGLSDIISEGIFKWSDTTPVTWTKWNPLEPNDYGVGEDCVMLYRNGGWNDIDCNKLMPYMCKQMKSMQPAYTGPPTESGCPPNYIGYKYSCYGFMTNTAGFDAASKSCIAEKGHLVDISDRYEESFLTSQLAPLTDIYLIGLKENTLQSIYQWSDGSAVQFTNWDMEYPDDSKGSCVAATTGKTAGFWKNVQCTDSNKYICEIGRSGSTPPIITTTTIPASERCGDSTWKRFESKCYKSYTKDGNSNQLSWGEARSFCRSFGGDLATIPDISTNSFLQTNITQGSSDSNQYWIGLNSLGLNEAWSDGSPLTYTAWGDGQPNHGSHGENHCVSLIPSTGGRWFENHCAMTYAWVCSAAVGVPLHSTTTGPPPTNPQYCPQVPELGGYPWIYVNKTCFWASGRSWSTLTTWQQANIYCTNIDSTLVAIHTQEEEDLLIGLMQKLPYSWGTYWIGLNELTSPDASMQWSDGSAMDYSNWNPGEPNDAGFADESCVETYTNGKWNDDHCSTYHPFICQHNSQPHTTPSPSPPIKGNCKQGWFKADNKCYKFMYEQRMNWMSARAYCQKQGTKAQRPDLASIRDSATNIGLIANMGEAYDTHTPYTVGYWIGLTDHDSERQFRWTDNSELTFSNWNNGEPNNVGNEDCVTMFVSVTPGLVSKWNDANCANKYRFVCQMNPDPTLPVPTPPINCASNYTANHKSCYKLTSTRSDWDAAEDTCYDGASVHLASIITPFEEAFFKLYVINEKDPVWIGMNDRDLNAVYEWQDGWPVLYSRWGNGEPTSLGGEGCVVINANGYWDDVACNQTHKGVCKYTSEVKPTVTPYSWCNTYYSCPTTKNGIHWLDGGGCYCYYSAIEGAVNQLEAQKQCTQLESDLVSIRSYSENKFIADNILPYVAIAPWIGLIKSKASEGFLWTNGDAVYYTDWAPNQPDNYHSSEDCVEMTGGGTWNDISCYSNLNYICKVHKVPKPTASWAPQGICNNDPDWTLYNNDCYYVSSYWSGRASWQDAEAKCNAKGAHLTSMHSKDEMKFIVSYAKHESSGYKYWIGLSQMGSESGSYEWSDKTVLDFDYWNTGEPNDAEMGEDCVTMYYDDGKWNDDHCGKTYSFICEKPWSNGTTPSSSPSTPPPVVGGCPDGWETYSLSNKCYRFFGLTSISSEMKSQADALTFCHNYGGRSDLVSIHDDVENAFIAYHGAGSNMNPWIGLSDSFHEYRFLWTDQSTTNYVNWNAGEPNGGWSIGIDEDCVEMLMDENRAGRWNDRKCDATRGFVCEQRRSPFLPTPVPPKVKNCTNGVYFPHMQACYTITEQAKTWKDAEDYCERMGGTLASINDNYEQSFLYVMINEAKLDEGVWIGLNRVNDLFEWSDHWPVKFTNWAYREPSEKANELCIHMSSKDGAWDDTTCGAEYKAICKVSGLSPPVYPTSFPGSCPKSQSAKYPYKDAGTRNCFQIVLDQTVSFASANLACLQDGGSLASFHEQGDIDFVASELHYATTNLWIGLLRQTGGSFSWTDKTPLDITNWNSGEPNNHGHGEDCVQVLSSNGKWNDITCSYGVYTGYICSKPKLPSNSSTGGTPSQVFPTVTKPVGPDEMITPMTGFPDLGIAGIVLAGLVGFILVGLFVLMILQKDTSQVQPNATIPTSVATAPQPTQDNGFDNAVYEKEGE